MRVAARVILDSAGNVVSETAGNVVTIPVSEKKFSEFFPYEARRLKSVELSIPDAKPVGTSIR